MTAGCKRWAGPPGAIAILAAASGIDLIDQADFRLLDRKVVAGPPPIREQARFLRGLVRWIGFRQVAVPYKAERRHAGTADLLLAADATDGAGGAAELLPGAAAGGRRDGAAARAGRAGSTC